MVKDAKKVISATGSANSESDAESGGVSDGSELFTARMLHEHLETALQKWDLDSQSEVDEPETVSVQQAPSQQPSAEAAADPETEQVANTFGRLKALKPSTVLKSVLALLVAVVLGWIPIQRLFATTSAEAIINARVVTIRSPISGEIYAEPGRLDDGMTFRTGDELFTVKNPRAERSNLENLKRIVGQLMTNIAGLRAKEAVLRKQQTLLSAQSELFRNGRIETLEKQIAEIDAQIRSAVAQHENTEKTLTRARALSATATISQSNLEQAIRDERVASETVNQLRERRSAAEVELSAARQGAFIADGYNDMPQSAQRSLDVELELADVDARLAVTLKELAAVRKDVIAEAKRVQKLSTVVIRASISGRVWETMVMPGEYVNAGQVLMRLLDCGSAVVTASVSKSVFQKLMIGQRAIFKPSDGGPDIDGWIDNVSGLATLSSNEAIQSGLLTREPYHVTLKFPDLARKSQCQISRAGLVTFDTSNTVESAVVRVGDAQ
jgi:multidrug resistance efflux pump